MGGADFDKIHRGQDNEGNSAMSEKEIAVEPWKQQQDR
jgi:hypothetical protein